MSKQIRKKWQNHNTKNKREISKDFVVDWKEKVTFLPSSNYSIRWRNLLMISTIQTQHTALWYILKTNHKRSLIEFFFQIADRHRKETDMCFKASFSSILNISREKLCGRGVYPTFKEYSRYKYDAASLRTL